MGQIGLCSVLLFLSWAYPALSLDLRATGHDSRIDLVWEGGHEGYHVYRGDEAAGSFVRLTNEPSKLTVYSDFLGENDRRYYYRVAPVDAQGTERAVSETVSAQSYAMTDEELLTSVQAATLRYFWEYAHPVSGLARERLGSDETCTSGGTGFGVMAICVGVERGFLARKEAAAHLLKIVRFLETMAKRYHGAWSHWIDGSTGQTIPFSRYDDGGDLVETSFLIQGLLTVRQYFDRDNPVEQELHERITRLWEQVEWDWYLREPGGRQLYWHWSPKHGWKMNHRIGGHFNECMITYLLALASPTRPIDPACYDEGWAREADGEYANGNTYYGHQLWVGWPLGGPLFFTHYSFLGFDPRGKRDRYCNYFENSRNISLIHRAYCAANPGGHEGYSALCWGLTASDTPGGYTAHEPRHDNGTITPTAAISAMPYVPAESIATLRHFYHTYGTRLWGPFGFKDAFNLDKDWFARSYLAIDQGPIVVMIENHRTGLCWRLFMANPEIGAMLERIGWARERALSRDDEAPTAISHARQTRRPAGTDRSPDSHGAAPAELRRFPAGTWPRRPRPLQADG